MTLARPITRLATLALVAATLAVTGSGAAQADAPDPVAGALTAGDSLFPHQGNGGYDVQHYDIDLRVNVAVSPVSNAVATTTFPAASAAIRAVTTGAPLSSFAFDFQGSAGNLEASTLNVDSVTVDGVPATFSRIENTTTSNATTDVHKLVVTPVTPVDGTFTTVVNYSGTPVKHTDTDGSSEGWNNTTDGATFVNQPIGAMTAFPNNNTPRDKATYTFTINAPTTLTTSNYANAGGKPYQAGVASNGELISRTPTDGGSRTTWVWDQQEQMASELTLISIGRYDIYESEITLASGRTIPEWSFIDPAIAVSSQTTTLSTRAQLKAVLDFFESKYGPYPGNSTGLVTDVVPGAINYALETQDRSFFPNSAGRSTTYHELMHQWWGDSVAPTDWNDITLNEGPAHYSESQYPYEGGGSTTTATEQANFALHTSRASGHAVWTVPPAAMTQASQLFGSQVYERGSMTLEALRTSIGAANFETLMRQYQLTYAGGQISGRRTAAFQAMAEDISGRDLTAFFQTWWFTSGKPAWPVKFNLNLTGPTGLVGSGSAVDYTLSVRNTGKVAMPASGTTISFDATDLLDDATIGTLPSGVTQAGNTLTWTVPATALAATSTVTVPFTLNPVEGNGTLKATARADTLGSTCLDCTVTNVVGRSPITPAVTAISGGTPTVGVPLTADTSGWAAGTSFTYQWFIDGTPVPGATDATFTPTGDVVGLAVTLRVTGRLAGLNATSTTSAATPVGVRATLASSTPTISGTPQVGLPLTVSPGSWEPGTLFTYQWQANGANISGATGPTYTPSVSTQVGQTLTATVTGSKFGYTTLAKASASTAAVAAGTPLAVTPTPTLTGTPKVGVSYTATPGYWEDGVALTYQWKANGTNISPSGTSVAFTPTTTQLGQTLTVTVTGTKPGIPAVSNTSEASAAVELGTQVLQPTPSITGNPRALSASTGVPGSWDSGTARTYQWSVNGEPVDAATATTYTPTLDQIGGELTFTVTSTRSGYAPVTKTSPAKMILGLAQTLTPTPILTGSPQVGTQLNLDPGTWDDGTDLGYQWYADDEPIEDANGLTYTPRAGDVGAVITATVTSTRAAYETVTRTSEATEQVAVGELSDSPVPTITGTPQVGLELTAVPGIWDEGTALTYQWLADDEPLDGATGDSFVPGAGQVGLPISVAVTGSKTGFSAVTRTSDGTDEVAVGQLIDTPTPAITGTPRVGSRLTAVPGDWDAGTELEYQWSADDTTISGATGTTYTPGSGQAGRRITVSVTGTRSGYTSVTRTSDPTASVAAGELGSTPVPTITGTARVGEQLTVTSGAWDDGTALAYQWLADGAPISGATGTAYTPGASQLGAAITVAVTGTKAGYASVTRTSGSAGNVAPGDLASTPVPTIAGTPRVGDQLTASSGNWDDGTTLAYQWLADGAPISGATGPTNTPGASQLGAAITVAVTGTKPGYASVTRTSGSAGSVAPGDLASTPDPTIAGTAQVGRTVRATSGTWDSGTALTYQWLRNGNVIPGATGTSYSPAPGDVGKTLSVVVTGTKSGYVPVSRTSDGASVAAGVQERDPKPSIKGKPRVGETLRAQPGKHDAGTDLSFAWFADGDKVGGKDQTLKLRKKLIGSRITVRVTASKRGYLDVARTSDRTGKVR